MVAVIFPNADIFRIYNYLVRTYTDITFMLTFTIVCDNMVILIIYIYSFISSNKDKSY